MNQSSDVFRERDFTVLVERALNLILDVESIEIEPRLNLSARPDLIANLRSGRDMIIEITVVTPSTSFRLDRKVDQLKSYAREYQYAGGSLTPQLGLVVSGAQSAAHVDRLKSLGIDFVLGGSTLREAAPGLPWPDAVAGARTESVAEGQMLQATGHPLASALDAISPGRAEWVVYQGQSEISSLLPGRLR